MAEVRKGFETPSEVTEYFARKSLKPGFSWRDTFAEENAYAFTIAKATELELLTTFKTSIDEALRSGSGFETWRRSVVERLTAIGWGGPRLVQDPTGQLPERVVNFTAPGRLQTIFWGNTASARSAGQWERAQRTKDVLPYILYVRTASSEPRPEHLRWVGTILPVDDPFWRTHWPPNGWRCKCTVRQVGTREREQLLAREPQTGRDVRYSAERPDGTTRTFTNRRTGEISQVPDGIDPGWQSNPGLARSSNLMRLIERQLEAARPEDAQRVLEAAWSDPYLRIADKLADRVYLPAGVSQRLAAELDTPYPVVTIDTDTVRKRTLRDGMPIELLAATPRVIADGVVLPDMQDGRADVRNLVAKVGSLYWFASVVVSKAKNLRVRTIHPRSASRLQRLFEAAGVPWPWVEKDSGSRE